MTSLSSKGLPVSRSAASSPGPRSVSPSVDVLHQRLVTDLHELSADPIRMVVAPAGYGKTTLLRRLAELAAEQPGVTPAWYTASAAEVSPPAFVQQLARSLVPAFGPAFSRITQLDTLLHRLAQCRRDFVVFIDDAHKLAGRPSAEALTRLLDEAPPNVRFVVATRSAVLPAVFRLTATTPPYRADHRDLRLRPWETEILFREVYRRPLPPSVAATLCEQVEGWPAALHTFHMDTMPLAEQDRHAAAADPLWSSPHTRDYIAKTVLGPLPEDVRNFMVSASALGVLSGSLCDALLGRTDSERLLRKLAENQVLTWRCERDESCYRFHLLLQRYLESLLAERLGPQDARRWYRRAAAELVRFEHWPEAHRAYARAEDWVATGEILHHRKATGDGLADSAALPRTLFDRDPWVALARARCLRADGRFADAVRAYDEARALSVDPTARWQCAAERAGLARWLEPGHRAARCGDRNGDGIDDSAGLDGFDDQDGLDELDGSGRDLSWHLFDAVQGNPSRLPVRSIPGRDPAWNLVRALAAALDGRRGFAAALVQPVAACSDGFVSLAGRLTTAALAASAGRAEGAPAVFTALALEAEAAGWPWLARLARAARALADPTCGTDALAVGLECRAAGDLWGALLADVLLSAGTMRAGGDARPALRSGIAMAGRLRARVPELWLRVLLVDQLDRAGDPDADDERRLMVACAEDTGIRRALSHGGRFAEAIRSADAGADPAHDGGTPAERAAPAPPAAVVVRCLGDYQFVVAGTPLDLSLVRPQARTVLRILSMHAGCGLHEEKLIGALWPDAPVDHARHRLHVAISSLRTAIRRQSPPHAEVDIVRRGDTYSLRLPADSEVDLVTFNDAVHDWRSHGGPASHDEAGPWGQRALELYRGELLSDDGSAEWTLVERDRLRTEAATIATALATRELRAGNVWAAIRQCQRGLQIDELNNQLWHLLVEAQERIGNHAAARRALSAYHGLFAEAAPEFPS